MRDPCLLLITTFASATALVPRDPIPSTVYPPLCSIDPQVLSEAPSSTVFNISDGLHARCISALVPLKAKLPMPILFDFHGAGGNAEHYGAKSDDLGKSWISLAATHQFAVIGGESIQWSPHSPDRAPALTGAGENWRGGKWLIPEAQNDTTGLLCDAARDVDLVYMQNAIAALASHEAGGMKVFDTSRIFFTGCSMGSAYANWISQCWHSLHASSITAFATQSTGLKVKGDGLKFPPDIYAGDGTMTGECKYCKYAPAPVVKTQDLKACIVDQTGDFDFYKSSLALHAAWTAAGMRANASFSSGRHCQTRSFEWIADCLDDGTGRLFQQ